MPAFDLDGYTRILAGATNDSAIVDMGAYEYHSADLITIQVPPSGEELIAGQSALFDVAAVSSYPLTYRWLLNGTNLPGGGIAGGVTNAVLMLSGVTTNNAGNYQVVISNPYSSVTSSVAVLSVWQAPVLLAQPTDTVSSVFGSCSLSVTVTGAPPIYYQWRKNRAKLADGGDFSGSASPTLTISNAQFAYDGQYSLVASNSSGTVASTNITLTVVPVVVWGNQAATPPAAATNIVAIAAGADWSGDFDLALRSDGTIVQWGPVAAAPVDATNIVAIAAGEYFGLALRRDGIVEGWGDNSSGQTSPPVDLTNVVAIAAGYNHGLALLQNGTVVGWGDNSSGETTPPPGATNLVAIAAGYYESVALRQDGTVIGWGANYYGESTPPGNVTNAVAIAAGQNHVLALLADGTIVGWGYAGQGFVDTVPPPEATNVTAIAAGNSHSLALRQDGTVVGWGYDNFGEATIPANLTNVVAVSAREFHSLALVPDPGVGIPPTIVQQPVSCTPPAEQTAILNCAALGSLPLRFQWYFNGAPLAGRTNSWLALTSIQTNQAGNYLVVITNSVGSVTSQVAVVSETPGVMAQPVSQLAFAGSNANFSAVARPAWGLTVINGF